MTDDQRRGLVADLTRRLALLDLDSVRALDRIALRLEQLSFRWRRLATADRLWHLAQEAGGSYVTRCHGRWSVTDGAETCTAPYVLDRCLACQRAACSDSASDLDPLIAAVLDLLAAEDRSRANLREAARAEQAELGAELGGEG